MQLNIEEAAAVDILNNLILAPARKRKIENSEILYNGDDDDDEVESENDDDGEEDEEEDSYDATVSLPKIFLLLIILMVLNILHRQPWTTSL